MFTFALTAHLSGRVCSAVSEAGMQIESSHARLQEFKGVPQLFFFFFFFKNLIPRSSDTVRTQQGCMEPPNVSSYIYYNIIVVTPSRW